MSRRQLARAISWLVASLVALVAVGSGARAHSRAPVVGTVIIAHGGGPEWDSYLDSTAAMVRTGGPVAISLLMGPGAATHRFQDAVARVLREGAEEIVVVPLFVSSHSGHIDQVRFLARAVDTLSAEMMHHLHESGIERAPASVRIGVAAALDDSPELARALADRALALTRTPNEQALFLIGHGPNTAEDHAFWMTDLRRVADTIRAWTPFRDVKIGLVRDDAPAAVRAEAVREIRETIALQRTVTGRDVVVVPILISSGTITRGKLPADLVGLGIAYSGAPLLPHPAMARWIERRVKDRR